jgi:Protein of unknown function (DUF2911)
MRTIASWPTSPLCFNQATKINMNKYTLLCGFAVLLLGCEQQKKETSHQHHTGGSARNYADSVNTGIIPKDTLRGSPVRVAMANVGKNHVHIVYGSPGVRGRTIWGGLVAYDEVWVTGAHDATSVEFSKDVEINGQRVPAGKYALFTIPGMDQWTVILNSRWDQHLADEYRESEDILRMTVTPTVLSDVVQRLTYSVETDASGGRIVMAWEKIGIEIPFQNSNP